MEDKFNNQLDRMTHSVDCLPLFLQPSLTFPNGWAQEDMGMVAEMEIMFGLNNMDFHSPRLTWLQPLVNANSRD